MKRYVVLALVAMWLGTGGALAEPPPFPEFSAKRVKPPSSGARKRITVQIAPQERMRRFRPIDFCSSSALTERRVSF